MPRCTVRQGFLTLKECGGLAVALCSTCGRPTCVEHLVGEGPAPLCIECSAGQAFSADTSSDWDEDSGPSPTWRVGYREGFYRETGYSPPSSSGVAGGFATGGSFDDLDKEPFDAPPADSEPPLAEDSGPSLFDS